MITSRSTLLLTALALPMVPTFLPGQTGDVGSQFDVDIYGNVCLVNTERNTLQLFGKENVVRKEVGGSGWENDQFDHPSGVWARNGIDIFVADYGNHRIQRFDRSLNFVSTFSTRASDNPDERFGYPTDVALSRLGELFICDTENSRIVKVDRFNTVERTFGGFGAGKGRLSAPVQVEVGPKDAVYVLDGSRVAVFDAFGNYLHDLVPGLLPRPVALFADPGIIIVVDKGSVYFFDGDERPNGVFAVADVVRGGAGEIRGAVLVEKTLWVLTEKGIVAEPDPRPKNPPREP